MPIPDQEFYAVRDACEALRAENEQLRKALEPFAALGAAKGGTAAAEKIRALIGWLIEHSPNDALDLIQQFASNCLAARYTLQQMNAASNIEKLHRQKT